MFFWSPLFETRSSKIVKCLFSLSILLEIKRTINYILDTYIIYIIAPSDCDFHFCLTVRVHSKWYYDSITKPTVKVVKTKSYRSKLKSTYVLFCSFKYI